MKLRLDPIRTLNVNKAGEQTARVTKSNAGTFNALEIIWKTLEYEPRANPYSGSYFTRVYEARLDDASSVIWYLAGPKGKTVKVFFLNGNRTPYLETKEGWNIDGVEFKVRIDAGAKAMDWKALIRNAGA